MTQHKIILGDSRRMKELADASVHLVVTSPPYWQLKDYGSGEQIGFDQSYEEYINHLNLVWQECQRVLHPGCRLCINIGDQFARAAFYGRYKVIPIRTEIIKFCETVGFDYMGAIIWQKVTTTNTTGGATIMGSFPYPRNGILKLDYEFILLFRKAGQAPKVSAEVKQQSELTLDEWNRYFSGHWKFSGAKQDNHIAKFPDELPFRLIKMFTFVGETVLDPYLGSGTTTRVSKDLGRDSVGYEINAESVEIIKQRFRVQEPSLFEDSKIDFETQAQAPSDFEQEIRALPYVFRDPLALDKNVDPRQNTFGSRISQNSKTREQYFRVKQVLSADRIVLHDDQEIRLLGIKKRKTLNGRAVEFLRAKLQGQNVYLRFDKRRIDEDKIPLCYLYLKNRTFVNSLLIRKGLADVDDSYDYKHRRRFLSYRKKTVSG